MPHKNRKRLLSFILGVFIFIPVYYATAQKSETGNIINGEKGKLLDDYLSALEKKGFTGAAIVVDKETAVLIKGYVYADNEQHYTFNANTFVQWALLPGLYSNSNNFI